MIRLDNNLKNINKEKQVQTKINTDSNYNVFSDDNNFDLTIYIFPNYIKIEYNNVNKKDNIRQYIYNCFCFTFRKKINFKGISNFNFGSNNYVVEFYNLKYDLLPIGFLNDLKKILIEKFPNLKYNIIDIREKTKYDVYNIDFENMFKKIKLRDYQIEAVKSFFENECMGLIECPVASGKTIIYATLVKLINVKTLILVDRKELVYQGVEEFIKNCEFEKKDVGYIQGNNVFERKFNFVMIQSISKINNLNDYKFIIVDEVQTASAKTYQEILARSKASFRLGISGTISGLKETEFLKFLKIKSFLGDIIYKLNTDTLIKNKILADPKVYFIAVNDDGDNKKNIKELYFSNDWHKIEKKLIIENEYRNKLIEKITEILPKPCLILVSKIEHLKKIYNHIISSLK